MDTRRELISLRNKHSLQTIKFKELQGQYHDLLQKYARAENIIDELRFEVKEIKKELQEHIKVDVGSSSDYSEIAPTELAYQQKIASVLDDTNVHESDYKHVVRNESDDQLNYLASF